MLLGFKKQFAPKILDGSKKFTIRNRRKVEPKIGDTLHMYTGLRTKHTEKITSEHSLKGIQLVDILIQKQVFSEGTFKGKWSLGISVDGRSLLTGELEYFVRCDGFEGMEDFMEYWIKASGDKKEYFQSGKRKTQLTIWTVDLKDLVMYHWTDLRF